jgi:hypothetical protein
MSIRLSNAQVVRIRESLNRFNERPGMKFTVGTEKLMTEDLVEDILKEVLPPCPLAENKNGLQNANVS